MHKQPALEPEPEWNADDMETETMFADDDDLDLDDAPDSEVEQEPEPSGAVPVWRLVEMSRENRFLARELADFDDYDIMDGNGSIDSFQSEYAH